MTKKVKINEGESFKYEFEGLHEPIISPEVFELVQAEIARRKGQGRGQSAAGPFASRVVCGVCGGFYGPKV